MKIKYYIIYTLSLLSLLLGNDLRRVPILISDWHFEIGDNMEWVKPDFDDSNWEKITVPGTWEAGGFPGYDGYAWYRVKFKIKEPEDDVIYYLKLGAIDDVDATFVNGHLVGFNGSFPPNYITAHQNIRQYLIPGKYLNKNGANLISIRVYDGGGQGGIKWGDVGLYKKEKAVNPIIELSGMWKFKTGDEMVWKDSDFDDSDWNELFVPGIWQFQGYQGYEGFAWYRNEFELSDDWKNENMILLLGKVDDLDETYINGQLVGKTGTMPENLESFENNNWDWQQQRAYYIPKNLLNYNGKNTIAVRVFDGMTYGGIYEGPVGIITRKQYLEYKNDQKYQNVNDFYDFLESIFGN